MHHTAQRDLVEAVAEGQAGRTQRTVRIARIQAGGDRQADPATDAREHRHVLVAVGLVGDRVADDARGQLGLPQLLAGVLVHRAEPAVQRAVEHQPAIGDQGAAPHRELLLDLPLGLAFDHVERLDDAQRARLVRLHQHVGEHVRQAHHGVAALLRVQLHVPVVGAAEEHRRVGRIHRARLLVLAAHRRRERLDLAAAFQRRVRRDLDRAPGLHVDALGPVGRHELVGAQQGAVAAVQHIGEAVAVELHDRRHLLAVDGQVDQDRLVDAVVVPLVERGLLVAPHRLAGVDLAREQRHRPLVVVLAGVAFLLRGLAAAVRRAPQAGIAGAVVDQLEFRVVAVPAPRRAAAALPAFVGIGLLAEVAELAVLRIGLVEVRAEADVLVGAGGFAGPGLLAVGQRVRSDAPAHAELVAADAGHDLAVGDDRGHGDGLALLGIGELLLPHFLAGLGIECDHVAAEAAEHHLAVGVGRATVDRVAAGHRDGALVLLRGVLPQHLAGVFLRQVDREHVVRIGADHVHGAAHHQRLAFMAAGGVGLHLPRHLQILDVVAVDLGQRAVPGQAEVAADAAPVVRVGGIAGELAVGVGDRGRRGGRRLLCGGRCGRRRSLFLLLATRQCQRSGQREQRTSLCTT
ncbi:hypothetical protein NB713_002138 [Xanthomonas sacchari]|nr:hypothetical protein [Xanthomonas sacchari]